MPLVSEIPNFGYSKTVTDEEKALVVGVNLVEDWGGEKEGQSKKKGLIGYVN